MSFLARDDPAYGLAYYQAKKLDPDVVGVIGEPLIGKPTIPHNEAGYAPRIPPTARYRPPPGTFNITAQQEGPAVQQQQFNRPPGPPTNPYGNSEFICWGCNERGHRIGSCPILNEMLAKGQLMRDRATGRWLHGNGNWIQKRPGENLLQALRRSDHIQTHYISTFSESEYELDKELDEDRLFEDTNNDIEDIFAVQDFTFAVDRPEKQIAAKRRQVLDGVYPPRIRDMPGKENQPPRNEETGRITRGIKGKAETAANNKPAENNKSKKQPTPIDVNQPRFDGRKDADILEDRVPKRKDFPNRPQDKYPDLETAPRSICKSAVSAHVDAFQILDRVLSSKVELAVGEVIGVSCELTNLLHENIKLKPSKETPTPTVGLTFRPKTQGLLIKVNLECDGRPVQAIIDTGS